MINANAYIGKHNVLMITFDTLRYDVAAKAMSEHHTPFLSGLLPNGLWEKRHTPATFTYAAHHAFFSGYLPTPTPKTSGYKRLFACEFAESSTTGPNTWVSSEATLVEGLAKIGYHTICIGGVGFFNRQNKLGSVLPDLFEESHWSPELGVTNDRSTYHQVKLAKQCIDRVAGRKPFFLFINLSAMHQPNCIFSKSSKDDSPTTQLQALAYVDGELPALFNHLQSLGNTLCILTSDHGTTYGEDNMLGHGIAHPNVWEVPYQEFILEKKDEH